MITIVICGLMLISFALALTRHGPASLVTLGVVGLFAYSLPALLDIQAPFALAGTRLGWIPTPIDTDVGVLVAWLALVPTIIPRAREIMQTPGTIYYGDLNRINDLAVSGSFIIIAGHLLLSLTDGLLYFAQAREIQTDNYATLLWKWSIPLTLVLSVMTQKKWQQTIVLFGIAILFLRGDRTMLAISLFSGILSYREKGGRARDLLAPKRLALILASSMLLLVGKPIYLSLKSLFLTGVYSPAQNAQLTNALASFEPIGTMYHLTFVIQNDIGISFVDFLISVFGNLLIIPSLFGVNTNLYGDTVTGFVGPGLTYGIAGSYLAHGYSVGGLLGVAAFAIMYGLALFAFDGAIWRSRGVGKASCIVIGATLAGYIHRNGLDNFGSFIRQVILMAVVMAVLAWLVRLARSVSKGAGRSGKQSPNSLIQ